MILGTWMRTEKLTDEAMASRVGVTASAIRKYRRGERIPGTRIMASIVEATGGQVTANDFYEQAQSREAA